MVKDSLTWSEAKALLALPTTTSQQESTRGSWLCGSDRNVLLTALDHDAEEVYLPLKGRTFTITYDKDKVWVQSAHDYVPCGWFSPRLVRIEAEQDNVTTT